MRLKARHRIPTLVGAAVGLAAGLFGAPIHSTLAVRVILVGGMVLGVTLLAALFTIAGAAAGAAVSVLVSEGSREPADAATPRRT